MAKQPGCLEKALMGMNKNGEDLKFIDKALELDLIFKNVINVNEELLGLEK